MNAKRFPLILLALAGVLLLSACSTAASRGSSWPGLAADADAAYLADGAQIYAVRLRDGAELWRYPAKADAKMSFYADPVLLGDGRMVIGSAGTDHCLYLIDTTKVAADTKTPDANCFFAAAQDRWVASPLVVDNVVYAPNNDGTLYVVDMATGELLWSVEIGGGGHLWAKPVTDGTNLYVSSLDHHLYAIDLTSHAIAWAVDLGGSVPNAPAFSADGKTLYVGSLASKVFALNVADGSTLWEAKTQKWVWGSPVVDGDKVYAADLDGYLYALDAATGKVLWNPKPADAIAGSPLVLSDKVIVTTESGGIFAYDKDGKQVWPATIKGKLYTPAVQSGDLIVVAPLATGAEYYMTILSTDGIVQRPFKPQ
ncbi:MAG: PQQ-binding-like beta-propeller repeat protein [Chloroflexi bacterium]|nr:PQQ-binding-like beta-propeller repeat protein [Chloroflexota bacterium]